MDYGKAIRIVRAARGIAQKDLARISGLDPSYISLLESGDRAPSQRAIAAVAKALTVPVHVLAILASEERDIRRTSPEHVHAMGRMLLEVIVKAGA